MSEGAWQALVALLAIGLVFEGIVIVALARQVGTILLQIAPPRPGGMEGGPTIGEAVAVDTFGMAEGTPTIFMFLSPDCVPCREFVPSIPVAAAHYRDVKFVPIVLSDEEGKRNEYAQTLHFPARTDLSSMQEKWNVPGTPFAVGLDSDGIVREKGVVNNLDQLESLAETVQLSTAEFATPLESDMAAGAPAPLQNGGSP